MIALCNSDTNKVDTIAHDFANKAFTQLGNYEEFVTRAIVVETKKKEKLVKAAAAKLEKIAKRTGVARSAIKIAVK